ncbi:MAG: IS256 family transposase, partial [Mobiluncus porci]|nr:IS256 family transposase [Mobiluncus porci]
MKCPECGTPLKRNGKTSSGSQRWRCKECGGSKVCKIDNSAKELNHFLGWLLSPQRQKNMPGKGRSFRGHTVKFWCLWPFSPIVDEVHDVVFVDGIYLGRKAVVLIACTRGHVLGWYVARSENTNAWKALLDRIAPPLLV